MDPMTYRYKTIVTGAAGFIGGHFMEVNKDKLDIVAVDSLEYASDPRRVHNARVKLYTYDISDYEDMERLFKYEKPEFIVNFAAMSHVDRSLIGSVESLIETNVQGVAVLLDLCKKYEARMLQCSTDETLGETFVPGFPGDRLSPRNPYAGSKAAAEMLCKAAQATQTCWNPVVITRGSNTFGPKQYPEKLIPFFITRLLRGKKVPLYGEGLQKRQWISVDSHCAGIWAALFGPISEPVYHLPGGAVLTNYEITQVILKKLGLDEEWIKRIEDPRGAAHDQIYQMGADKYPGDWQPETREEVLQKLEETVQWYIDNEDWWGIIVDNPQYKEFVKKYYGKFLGEDL